MNTPMPAHSPLVLLIRDGWGRSPLANMDASNAIKVAHTPVCTQLLRDYPNTLIATSGFDVGLPEGTMGNSEVGHQNIGAGRIVDQESVAITKACRNGQLLDNATLVAAVQHAIDHDSNLHLMGIVSDAGVHGQLEHLYGCLELAQAKGLHRVFVHAFTDGRDTAPTSGFEYVRQVEAKMTALGVGRIASVSGRFYAMDRDNRWPRVERCYRALTDGAGPHFTSAGAAIDFYYQHPDSPNTTGDEFVPPSVIVDDKDVPLALIRDRDSVIFYNYRGDRPREITKAFVLDDFDGFARKKLDIRFTTMTAYEVGLPVHVAYPKPPKMINILGEYLSNLGLEQFRCAESEKFPHVTFFFNDYREQPYPGETRVEVPSRKDVATYDLVPEMSAAGITAAVVSAIESRKYALIVVNYANGDMVGHTGNLAAAIKAVECVDHAVGEVVAALRKVGGVTLIFADHGNAEQMVDPVTGGPHTAHTTYPVEIIAVDDRLKGRTLREGGRLADVAPTALAMMNLPVPNEMSGHTLII